MVGCRPLHRGCGLKLVFCLWWWRKIKVALFTEGVDWNHLAPPILTNTNESPSSQRVWIEIDFDSVIFDGATCRPLHRGCGLKSACEVLENAKKMSPSSQRVWIEILMMMENKKVGCVALFTEGVDWNLVFFLWWWWKISRPLHRGCGLKFRPQIKNITIMSGRPLHRGCGLKYHVRFMNCHQK